MVKIVKGFLQKLLLSLIVERKLAGSHDVFV